MSESHATKIEDSGAIENFAQIKIEVGVKTAVEVADPF
jgi:hypothetical protein